MSKRTPRFVSRKLCFYRALGTNWAVRDDIRESRIMRPGFVEFSFKVYSDLSIKYFRNKIGTACLFKLSRKLPRLFQQIDSSVAHTLALAGLPSMSPHVFPIIFRRSYNKHVSPSRRKQRARSTRTTRSGQAHNMPYRSEDCVCSPDITFSNSSAAIRE
jgi:hypothetical protein